MSEDTDPYFVHEDESSQIIEINEDSIIENLDDIDINEEDELDESTIQVEDKDDEVLDVIEPERDDAILVFDKHADEVFTVKVGKNGIAASGGKDDTAYIFNYNTGDVLFQCTGHRESVEVVCFNHNNTYVATGDLDGCIKVWSISEGSEIWSFDISEIQWMTWHPKAPLLLAGDVEGTVWLWNIPYSHSKTLPSHGHACICGSFLPDGKRTICGYEDGSLRIWDLKTSSTIHQFLPSSIYHQASILSLDCHHENTLVASGSADGSVMIVNSISGQILKKFLMADTQSSHENFEDESNGVESLTFSTRLPYLAIGSGAGDLIVWDLNMMSPRFSLVGCHQGNVIDVIWHPKVHQNLFSSSVDGSIICWDVRTAEKLATWVGHRSAILRSDITPDGDKILTASADKTIRIYSIELSN